MASLLTVLLYKTSYFAHAWLCDYQYIILFCVDLVNYFVFHEVFKVHNGKVSFLFSHSRSDWLFRTPIHIHCSWIYFRVGQSKQWAQKWDSTKQWWSNGPPGNVCWLIYPQVGPLQGGGVLAPCFELSHSTTSLSRLCVKTSSPV